MGVKYKKNGAPARRSVLGTPPGTPPPAIPEKDLPHPLPSLASWNELVQPGPAGNPAHTMARRAKLGQLVVQPGAIVVKQEGDGINRAYRRKHQGRTNAGRIVIHRTRMHRNLVDGGPRPDVLRRRILRGIRLGRSY